MTNQDLRIKAKTLGVPLWQIGEALGVSEITIIRRLRKELTPEQKQMYLGVIMNIVAERAKADLSQTGED